MERLSTVLMYLASGSDQIDSGQLSQVIHQTLDQEGDQLMSTIAQQWIEQGREEGIEKGREEGIEQGLLAGICVILELPFPERPPPSVWPSSFTSFHHFAN